MCFHPVGIAISLSLSFGNTKGATCFTTQMCCLKIERDIEVEEREDAISAIKGSPSLHL